MTNLPGWLRPLFTARFVKFCGVGLSGVGINLLALYLFADILEWNANLSSALGIEISIISNFVFNDAWTFRDRRESAKAGFMSRMGRYHVTAIIGGIIQWLIFIVMNVFWLILFYDPEAYLGHLQATKGLAFFMYPITHPPEVGWMMYLSQLFGIGAATFWNFLVNFFWTWRQKS